MDIILLERVPNLGQMGEVVSVKDGYARNFLLPEKKAMRATKANKAYFETIKQDLEARNLERKEEAEGVASKLDGESFVLIRQAGETGQLYGSVTSRDVAVAAEEKGFKVARSQVRLDRPIKTLGLHVLGITLYGDVAAQVTVNVARSEDEAERQARGEDVLAAVDEDEDEEALAPEEVFEEGVEPGAEGDAEEADAEAPGEAPVEADEEPSKDA
jgi:large subunit ribosomal protein L9